MQLIERGRLQRHRWWLLWILSTNVVLFLISAGSSNSFTIGYDHRALIINGTRRFLISGSIHYPRSTPQMWPRLFNLAKEGGLDVIDTYVFWNIHEPVKGAWNFEGRRDVVGFLKAAQNAGLLVTLRIGPFVCAEWNFGGFPEWLRDIPGIKFRTDNEPFKAEMTRFVAFIVEMMKANDLFIWQGGPIILVQIENEYRHVAKWYGEAGTKYSNWAAAMVENLNASVPWIMCSQLNASANIIDTCNGFYCHQFEPNHYSKPKLWTENYPGWFHYWGNSQAYRPVEDTAYAVARFFQKGGSYMNYYMYHGGTNFDRTAGRGITTSYDYHAPIDEYGRVRHPDWDHFKKLHAAIKLCEPALAAVNDDPFHWNPERGLEFHVYSSTALKMNGSIEDDNSRGVCAAFLANNGMDNKTVKFHGKPYFLPAWSVTIIPDCVTAVFNTAMVGPERSVAHSFVEVSPAKNHVSRKKLNTPGEHNVHEETNNAQWEWFAESVGTWGETIVNDQPLEQFKLTQDTTDYLWYATTINLPKDETPCQVLLRIRKVQDLVHVFINGNLADETPTVNSSGFYIAVSLDPGNNSIALLSVTTGLSPSGPFLEARTGGLRGAVTLQDLPYGQMDLTHVGWTHKAGLKGEELHLESENGTKKIIWSSATNPKTNHPLIWYKAILRTPPGSSPVVLDLGSMSKGAAWINGHHLGRYWLSQVNPWIDRCGEPCDYRGKFHIDKCLLNCGQLSQRWYHVPREWTTPEGNAVVLFEEIGGDPRGVSMATVP